MKTNPNQQSKQNANSGRLDQSWSTMISAMKEYHGTSNLPVRVPTKDQLIAGFMALPDNAPVQQVSEAASAFQFRKCFAPSFKKADVWQSYKDVLSTPSPPVDTRFHEALLLAVKALPQDWDRGYKQEVNSTVPSFKSNLEGLSPKELDATGFTADAFKDACLGRRAPFPINPEKRCKILNDRGKARTITIASATQLQLRPLHRVMQSALFKTGVVLRGPPTPTNMSGMRTVPGEVFVSGDYKAATDGFNLNNSVYAIQVLRETSSHIPESIWDLAELFLSESTILFEGKDPLTGEDTLDSFDQEAGQLMGNFLSFPLLCLINLAGVFLGLGQQRTQDLIDNHLLMINGDDIVFRCSEEEYHSWRQLCPVAGLNVSVEKTLVHKRVFTVNSFYFTARPGRVPRKVWVYRASAWQLKLEEEKLTPAARRARRGAAINDVIGVHIEGICNAEKRAKMRYLFQKIHEKKVEGVSLTVKIVDAGHAKGFKSVWRKLVRATEKTETLCAAVRQVGVLNVKIENARKSNIKPCKEMRLIHREVSQYIAWARERIDSVSNFSFTGESWRCPSKVVGQCVGKGVGGGSEKKWGSFVEAAKSTSGGGIGFKEEEVKWWYLECPDSKKLKNSAQQVFVPRTSISVQPDSY